MVGYGLVGENGLVQRRLAGKLKINKLLAVAQDPWMWRGRGSKTIKIVTEIAHQTMYCICWSEASFLLRILWHHLPGSFHGSIVVDTYRWWKRTRERRDLLQMRENSELKIFTPLQWRGLFSTSRSMDGSVDRVYPSFCPLREIHYTVQLGMNLSADWKDM